MAKVQVMEHPLIQHKMSYIRDEKTSTKEFRELVDEVGMLMAYEVTRDLSLEDVEGGTHRYCMVIQTQWKRRIRMWISILLHWMKN